ncbi:hypothetical protein EV715DRAFT_278055 [Schizophyllum commune]
MPDDFPPLLLDDDDVQNDPDLAWYSDKGSGGYHLPFGKHTGRTVNEVPESYLVWAKTHLKGRYGVHRSVSRTLRAIETFVEGLEGCLDEWFADFIVPCGVHHRGKTIRRCSDRAWLSWVVGRDRVRRSHPLFVKAVHIWLGSKTRLKAAVDPTTFLPPARYHADLREGQSMPHEGDVFDDGVESRRTALNHAESDASITDPEDEEDHPSQRTSSPAYRPHSPAYRPHSRGSSSDLVVADDRVSVGSSNFVVADDRVSVSTDDSAYGELERAESLLRSAQKRRISSNDRQDESPTKRRVRHRHRVESTSSSSATHDPTRARHASSSSPSPPRTHDGSPARIAQEPEQARIAQEPEQARMAQGPEQACIAQELEARALAASQARGEAATSASGGASSSATNHASCRSATGRPSWSASVNTAHKKPIRTLARLVDPPTPEPDGADMKEGGGAHGDAREEEEDVHADVREEEEEEVEVEEEVEAQEQEGAPRRERVEDCVPDSESEDEGLSRAKGGPSVEGCDPIRATHGGNGRRLVFSHVELPTRPRRSISPPPAVAPRRDSHSSRAEDTPSASMRNTPATGTRNIRGSALESSGRQHPEVRVTRAAARRHSPPPTASRSPRKPHREQKRAKSASAFTASQDEEVEDSEGETAIMISAGVRAGRATRSTPPVAVSSGKSSASATPSGANDPRSSASKIASSSTAVASSSFVSSRLSSAPRPSATPADAASDATSLRARFPKIPSSVLAARMRGVVEEVPRDPTPEGEWEWYLDEFDILNNEPLAALALLADVLRPLGSQDRDSGCTYVLGGRWNFDRPELLRSEANERVEYLSKAISDLQTAGDEYVPLTEICDDRMVLECMRAAIARGLEVCKDVPVFWGLAYWAITFRLGFTDYREQIASFPYRTLALVTLVLICLYFTFITHATNCSTPRVEYELQKIRKQSHRWLLAWKALQGIARKMLDDKRIYERRGQHIIHILAQMDHLIECPHESRIASREPTVIESLNARTVHLPGRHALARDMVARILPVIAGEQRGSGLMGHASSDGPQSFDNAGSTRLDDMITAACNELSIRDALFRYSVRPTYGLLRTRPLSVNTFRPQLLKGAVDELVQALKNFPQPEFFQETHQPAESRRTSKAIKSRRTPFTRAATLSSRVLRDLLILPLFVIPTFVGGGGLVDGLFGAAYVWIVRTHFESISLCALKGLQDYGCSYRDHVGVQSVREAAARVELYANYHLVHLKLLQKITNALLHPRDPEDSAALDDLNRILATLNNSNASSTNSISAALEFALTKRSERPLEVGPYAHADVVRRLIDEHYPFFQREMGPRGRKRGRRDQADGDEDGILLLDEFEIMGVEGPPRQRFRTRANMGDDPTTWA